MSLINFCTTWKNLVHPLWDIEFQKKHWFHEEDEFNSFDDATGDLIQRYLDDMQIPERHFFYQNKTGELLKELFQKVHRYTTDSSSLDNSVKEENFFSDPNWLSIVALAKQVDEALNERIREVKIGNTK